MIKVLKVLIILVTLIVVGYFTMDFFLDRWLNRSLPTILNKNPARLYEIKYQDVAVDWMDHTILLHNLAVDRIDTTAPGASVRIASFLITGFNLRHLFFEGEIIAEEVTVQNPYTKFRVGPPNAERPKAKTVNIFWEDVYTRTKINNIRVNGARVEILQQGQERVWISLGPMNVQITGVSIDTATINHPFPFEYSTYKMDCDSVSWRLNDLYSLSVGRFSISEHSVQLDSVTFSSYYDKLEFQDHIDYQQEWYNMFVQRVNLNKYSWSFPEGDLNLRANLLKADGLKFSIYRDKNKVEPEFKKKYLFPSKIRRLPFLLDVDTVALSNSKVQYEELPADTPEAGAVFFDDLFATAYYFTNNPETVEKEPPTTVDITGNFMGVGELEAQIIWDIDHPKDRFTCSGNLGPMSIGTMSPVIKKLAGVEMEGDVLGMHFDVAGDDSTATGTMDFEFENFKITVLKKGKNKRNWFLTQAGNAVVKSRNTKDQGKFRQGQIYFERLQGKSFFNYIWNCVKEGIIDTVVKIKSNKSGKKEKNKGKKDRKAAP